MLILSGDIRNLILSGDIRNLSKIGKNFGRFFGRYKFLGADIVKIVPNLSPLPRRASSEKKSREDNPTSPEVIESSTLNFMPGF